MVIGRRITWCMRLCYRSTQIAPLRSATSQTRKTLPYLPRLLKHIAATTPPPIANQNSKPSVDVGVVVGEIVREGEGNAEETISVKTI